MKRARRILFVATAVIVAPSARGDDLDGTLGASLKETEHRVSIALDGGIATITVVRRIENAGDVPDEATLAIALPPGGVATGLRVASGNKWIDGELLQAIDAEERYEELTGIGRWSRARDPALLSWAGRGGVTLRVFPIGAGATSKVEYTIIAPAEYEAGRFVVRYPTTPGADTLVAPDVRAPKGAEVRLDRDAIVVSIHPPRIEVASARYGSFQAGPGRVLRRIDVAVAPEIAPPPKGARVVFVIDASRSQGEAGIDRQLALVRGYLDSLPDARYELVIVRRRAERLIGSFATARELERSIDRERAGARFAPGNGSNLDAGLAAAASALGDADHRGPRRIVAFTDGALRDAFATPEALSALTGLGGDAVVHLVKQVDDGAGALRERRDDDDPLATIANAHGGVLIRVDGSGDRAAAQRVARGWVQPIRIDGFTIEAPGETEAIASTELAAGEGLRSFAIAERAPPRVTISGKIWGRSWSRSIDLDRELGEEVAALAFGDAIVDELSEEEMHRAAAAGGAVSPVTSYLAIEPGARPTPDGIDLVGEGSLIGGEIGDTYGAEGVNAPREPRAIGNLDASLILRQWLAPSAARCGVGEETRVIVEVTRDEIVDVTSDDACLAEAAWGLWLDERFRAPRDRIEVTIPPAR